MSRILSSLRYPLIQAPMAFAHDTELPLAVGKTGALGSLAGAMYDAAGLDKALARMKQEGGDRPYNLNFFAHRTPSTDRAQHDAWFGVLRPYFEAYGLTENDIPTGGGRQPFDTAALECVERYRRLWSASTSVCPRPNTCSASKRRARKCGAARRRSKKPSGWSKTARMS